MAKPLSKRKQEEYLDKAKDVIWQYRRHWDGLYKGQFADYRKMSKGRLPTRVQSELDKPAYINHSKLIPRMIPDAIKYLTVTADSALFSRPKLFGFAGRRGRLDNQKSKDAYDVVAYEFEVTGVRKQMKMAMKDACSVGAGFLERHHYVDRRLSPQYRDIKGEQVFDRRAYDIVYAGPKVFRIAPEMMLIDPYAREIEQMTGYVKLMVVSKSSITKESVDGGLYENYRKNIKEIKASDFDEKYRSDVDIEDDHNTAGPYTNVPDFPVLITEWWMSVSIEGTPVWTVMTIANWEQSPQLLRYDIDPMETGEHPLVMAQISPVNDRLYGESVPEIAEGFMIEQFFKRNQAINLINIAAAVGGIVVMPQGMIDKNSVLAKLNKILVSTGGAKGQTEQLKLDLSSYPALIQESSRIQADAERSLAMAPIRMGISPERAETATAISTIDQNAKVMSNDPIFELEESMIKPTAQGFLLHTQLLTPPEFTIRVLGREREYTFREMKRVDILGRFDVKCHASSEITTKSIKQALFNNLASLYLPNPMIKMDRQAFAIEHFELNEIGNARDIIDSATNTDQEIERENNMLLNGIYIEVLPHEDHPAHITGHLKKHQEAQDSGAPEEALYMLQAHEQAHEQVNAQLQGQPIQGQGEEQKSFKNKGEQLNNLNSDLNARISG